METEIQFKIKEQEQIQPIELYYCFGCKEIESLVILPSKQIPIAVRSLTFTLLYALGCEKTTQPCNWLDAKVPRPGIVASDYFGQHLLIKEVEWI